MQSDLCDMVRHDNVVRPEVPIPSWKKSDNFKAVDFKVIYLFTSTYVYTCAITDELRNTSDTELCYLVPCFDHG